MFFFCTLVNATLYALLVLPVAMLVATITTLYDRTNSYSHHLDDIHAIATVL